MASYYSNTYSYRSYGGTAQVRADVTYSREGTTGYKVTLKAYMTATQTSSCPYYAYSCYQKCTINNVSKRDTTSVNPNASWKGSVLLFTCEQSVDPGGPSYSCPFSVTYRVPSGTYTFTAQRTFTINDSITLPSTWQAPTQTFSTFATNTTTNNSSSATNRGFTDNTHQSGATSYVGDSFSYTWDKNDEANVGSNADPTSYAYLARSSTNNTGSDNNHPSAGTDIHTAWGWTGGSGDLYVSGYTYTAVPADAGNYLLACMYKHYKDSSGNSHHFHQANGHYIQSIPTISATYNVRAKRLYRGSPSTVVSQVSAISVTTNGYRIHRRNSGQGVVEFHTNASSGIASASRDNGDGQTSNYSMNAVYQLVWRNVNSSILGAGTYNSGVWTRYQSPNLTNDINTGYDLSTYTAAQTLVDGTFSKIVAKNLKVSNPNNVYPTSNEKMNFLIEWAYDGSHNNVRGDYRIERSSDGTNWGVDAVSGNTISKDWLEGWGVDTDLSSTHWTIDQSGTTYVAANVVLSTSGYYYKITLIPSSTDSAGYQIFGEPIQLVTDKIYRVIIPAVPKVNYITSILPPIVGIANNFYYKYQNTTNWGNYSPNTNFKHIRRQYYDSTHYEDFTDTSNITASGYVEGVYSKTVPSTSTGSLTLRVKSSVNSSSWDDTIFTSAQSNYKSLALIAQKKYSITASDVVISTPLATTLLRNIPFTLTLPAKTINGNYLTNSGSIWVDGVKSSDFTDLSYTLGDVAGWGTTFVGGNTTLGSDGVCTSISGDRTVTFADKSWSTDTLTRGVHTIQVKAEILTYFDSSGKRTINGTDYNLPTNHVLFGTTSLLSSNTLTVEIGDTPAKPTINTPNPQYFNAGQERTLTWTFSPNDWGVNDTTYNNRHYDYELYNPAGTKIQSGTIAKGTTSYSYTFTPYNKDVGEYKFKLREVNVLGTSAWEESIISIQKAIEPSLSEITTSEVIALNPWDYTLTIKPGNNGSYKPVTTAPITRYKIDVIQRPKNLYNPSFITFDSSYISSVGSGWYKLNADRTSATTTDFADWWTNWNEYLKPDTEYTYIFEVRNTSINREITINLGNTISDSEFTTQFVDWIYLNLSDANQINGTHLFYIKTKADMKSANLYTKICCRDFVTLPAGCKYSLEFRCSLVEGHIEAGEYTYSAYKNPYIANLVGWTNANNGATINRSLRHNLEPYLDGTYDLYIPYERYYTTFTSRESLITQIIPPEIVITDRSTVEWVGTDKAEFNFKMFVDVFGWCGTYKASENPHLGGCWAEYSLDYGKTWTRAYDSNADKVINIPLTWLDEIWLRGFGANPVDTDDKFTIGEDENGNPIQVEIMKHDMYSCYKAWLAKNNTAENWTRKIHLSHNNAKEKKVRKITKE